MYNARIGSVTLPLTCFHFAIVDLPVVVLDQFVDETVVLLQDLFPHVRDVVQDGLVLNLRERERGQRGRV